MLRKFREWYASIDSLVSSKKYLSKRVNLKETEFTVKNGQKLSLSIASLAQVDDLITLQRSAYEGKVPWGRSALIKDMTANPFALYLIAMDEKHIPAGFIGAWMIKQEAHITNICVAPQYQGLSIGSKLIEVMEEIAIKENMTKYSLEVRVSNTNAYRLYQFLGFKDMGIKPRYYLDNGEDAIDMCKPLSKTDERVDRTREE